MKSLWKWFRKYPSVAPAIWLTTLAQLADIWTTSLGFPDGVIESNTIARHLDGSPWIVHLVVIKILWALFFGAFSWTAWACVKRFNRHLAEIAAAAPLLYFAWGALDAAVSNLAIHWGWLVVG